jgi:hypothetical protein
MRSQPRRLAVLLSGVTEGVELLRELATRDASYSTDARPSMRFSSRVRLPAYVLKERH